MDGSPFAVAVAYVVAFSSFCVGVGYGVRFLFGS